MASSPSYIPYLCVAAAAFITTFLAVPLVKRLAIKLDAVDYPSKRRINTKPIPRLGGTAVFLGLVVACTVQILGTWYLGWPPVLVPHPRLHISYPMLALSFTVIFATGAIDDVFQLTPKQKLAGQVLAALIACMGGLKIGVIVNPFAPGEIMLGWLAYPITVIYLVAFTNIINLIDGLDGLACGVSTISAISMLVIALLVSESDVALVIAALVGACLGFMPYNKNPAKMFMGDTGSTFLGYILATISIQGLFKYYAIVSFAVPFLILGLPMFDTLFAIIRRLAHGQNPMAPDRGHIHHRLIDMGLNQKQAVAALYVISSILGLSAVMLTSSGAIKAMLFLMALAVAAFLASRVIFRRDIDKAMQAEKAAAEEKSTETATPAETVPAEPEEESNEEKKEEA